MLGCIVTHIHFEKTSVTHCPLASLLLLVLKDWIADRGLRLTDVDILKLQEGIYDRKQATKALGIVGEEGALLKEMRIKMSLK